MGNSLSLPQTPGDYLIPKPMRSSTIHLGVRDEYDGAIPSIGQAEVR